MAITVQGTPIGSIIGKSYTSASGDVSLQTGINPVLTLGSFHCTTERKPVVRCTDGEKLISRSLLNP